MTFSKLLFGLLFIFCTANVRAQVPVDTLLHKLDSLSLKNDSLGYQKNDIAPAAYNNTTRYAFA